VPGPTDHDAAPDRPEPADDEPLGPLEAQLLASLWATGTWMSAPELHELVAHTRPIAYTTVSTVLIRLWHKGHVERIRDGRSFAYRALRTREQYTAARMAGLLADLEDRPRALSWFLEFLGPAERAQLRRLLKRDRPAP
jgi:predicted transcriptional regulator